MGYRFIVRIIHGLIWITIAYKLGDWKNYRKYYPTMLFMGTGNLIYNVIYYKKRLWDFNNDLLAFPFHELFIIFMIFFPSVLVFLTHYPSGKRITKRILYLVMWVFIYTGIEVIMYALDMIDYYNNWNFSWSILHNSYQFPLLYLHHRNPVYGWIVGFAILGFILFIFKVPLLA